MTQKILHNWKSPYKDIIENQEIRKVLSETHASGNREASTHNNCWGADWWNKYEQERSTRTWNDEVWDFLNEFCTDTDELNNFLLSRWSWSDECWFFFSRQSFFRLMFSRFRTHVVATTVCTTGVYTHSSVARTFFWHIFLAWRSDIA